MDGPKLNKTFFWDQIGRESHGLVCIHDTRKSILKSLFEPQNMVERATIPSFRGIGWYSKLSNQPKQMEQLASGTRGLAMGKSFGTPGGDA